VTNVGALSPVLTIQIVLLVSQRSLWCILMQSRREQQRIMGAIEWLPLAKAKRVEWGAGMRFSPLSRPAKAAHPVRRDSQLIADIGNYVIILFRG